MTPLPPRSMTDNFTFYEPAPRGTPNVCTCGREREHGCERCNQSLCDYCGQGEHGSLCDVCILRCPRCDGGGVLTGPEIIGRRRRPALVCRACGGTGRPLSWWHHSPTARTYRWLAEAGQHPRNCDCEFCGANKFGPQNQPTERSFALPSAGRSVENSGERPTPVLETKGK